MTTFSDAQLLKLTPDQLTQLTPEQQARRQNLIDNKQLDQRAASQITINPNTTKPREVGSPIKN
jgi:hypothetical protein